MLKISDKVTISDDLKVGFISGVYINKEMLDLKGTEQEIIHIYAGKDGNRYHLKDIPYLWPVEAFEGMEETPSLKVGGYVRVKLSEEVIENFSTGFASSMRDFDGMVFSVDRLDDENGNWATLTEVPYYWDTNALEPIPNSEYKKLLKHFNSNYSDKGLYRVYGVSEGNHICKIEMNPNKVVTITSCLTGKLLKSYANIFSFYEDKSVRLVCVERSK